jgi:hypothetical protein
MSVRGENQAIVPALNPARNLAREPANQPERMKNQFVLFRNIGPTRPPGYKSCYFHGRLQAVLWQNNVLKAGRAQSA